MVSKLRNLLIICGSALLLCSNLAVAAEKPPTKNMAVEQHTLAKGKGGEKSYPLDRSTVAAKININTADLAVLQQVKYMSKRKASAIIAYRNTQGAFRSLEELLQVQCRGIHRAWLDKVTKFLTI